MTANTRAVRDAISAQRCISPFAIPAIVVPINSEMADVGPIETCLPVPKKHKISLPEGIRKHHIAEVILQVWKRPLIQVSHRLPRLFRLLHHCQIFLSCNRKAILMAGNISSTSVLLEFVKEGLLILSILHLEDAKTQII